MEFCFNSAVGTLNFFFIYFTVFFVARIAYHANYKSAVELFCSFSSLHEHMKQVIYGSTLG